MLESGGKAQNQKVQLGLEGVKNVEGATIPRVVIASTLYFEKSIHLSVFIMLDTQIVHITKIWDIHYLNINFEVNPLNSFSIML